MTPNEIAMAKIAAWLDSYPESGKALPMVAISRERDDAGIYYMVNLAEERGRGANGEIEVVELACVGRPTLEHAIEVALGTARKALS